MSSKLLNSGEAYVRSSSQDENLAPVEIRSDMESLLHSLTAINLGLSRHLDNISSSIEKYDYSAFSQNTCCSPGEPKEPHSIKEKLNYVITELQYKVNRAESLANALDEII